MKRIADIALTLIAALAVLALAGCKTAPVVSSSANIDNPYVGFSGLEYGDYAVLGRVSGTGEVSYDKTTKLFTGDTLKYGYLGTMGNAGQLVSTTSTKFRIIPVTTTSVTTPSDCYGKAESNACYELIRAAREKEADAVIFVMKSFENRNEKGMITAKCTMTGVAVKLR